MAVGSSRLRNGGENPWSSVRLASVERTSSALTEASAVVGPRRRQHSKIWNCASFRGVSVLSVTAGTAVLGLETALLIDAAWNVARRLYPQDRLAAITAAV